MSNTRITSQAKAGKLYENTKVRYDGSQLVIEKSDGVDLSRTTLSNSEKQALANQLQPPVIEEPEPEEPTSLWRPYSDVSPFNKVVQGYTFHPKSAAVVRNITALGPSKLVINESPEWDYQHPRYHAKETDPVYTIKLDQSWTGSTNGQQIKIPSGARWAGYPSSTNPTDRHITIVQPDGWEYDFHKTFSINNGVIHANFGSKLRIDGDGRGGGATVANFGCLAGMIRSEELIAGQINHALFCTVKNSDGTNVWPALTSGAGAKGSDPTIWPPLGAHFILQYTDAEIDNLNISVWKKPIIRALARYGCYFGDTGGPGFAFMMESSETFRSFGQPDPAVAWAKAMGVPFESDKYRIDLRAGIDWTNRLKLIV